MPDLIPGLKPFAIHLSAFQAETGLGAISYLMRHSHAATGATSEKPRARAHTFASALPNSYR
jgi:hypothetical protein